MEVIKVHIHRTDGTVSTVPIKSLMSLKKEMGAGHLCIVPSEAHKATTLLCDEEAIITGKPPNTSEDLLKAGLTLLFGDVAEIINGDLETLPYTEPKED